MVHARRLSMFEGATPLVAVFGHYTVGERFVTTCEIGSLGNEDHGAIGRGGIAICAPGDRCNPRLGEVKALARALESTSFTRQARRQFQYDLAQQHFGEQRFPTTHTRIVT